MRKYMNYAALVSVGILGAATAVVASEKLQPDKVAAALKARLPKTQVSSIDCVKLDGMCEVLAGKNLFYVDGGGRYLFVGRVYDMETRQDLTAAKLLEVNPGSLIGGSSTENEEAEGSQFAKNRQEMAPAAPRVRKVDLSSLPRNGAIVWGKPTGEPVTIFTDFACGYCRMLAEVLEEMNVRVIERPISTLGSRDTANRVYCSKDKQAAVRRAYSRQPLPAANCDTAGLDANEEFARKHGFSGTPVIVRKDGSVLEGYRPREVLESWLKSGA